MKRQFRHIVFLFAFMLMALGGEVRAASISKGATTSTGFGWNLNLIETDNNQYSGFAMDSRPANGSNAYHEITASGFDFSAIPVGSSIDGIVMVYRRKAQNKNRLYDEYIKMAIGTDTSTVDRTQANSYNTGETAITYGGTTTTWEISPTQANISNLHVIIGVRLVDGYYEQGTVDQIQVTVYYTEGGGGDTEDPVANCQNVTLYLDSDGNATLSADDVDNSSTDNVGIDSKSLSKTAFTCSDLGSGNTVTLTVEDAAGNSDDCTATITVSDTLPPVATVIPTDVTDADGTYDPDEPTFTDNCTGSPTLTWVMTGATTGSGNTSIGSTAFNDGTTTITYTATDASGNKDSISFNINVPFTIASQCGPYTLSPPGGNIDTLSWVNECTGDTIDEKTPSVTPTDTCLYRLNYVDFNGTNLITNGDFESAPGTGDWADYTDYGINAANACVSDGNAIISTTTDDLEGDVSCGAGWGSWYDDINDNTYGDGTGKMFIANGSISTTDTVFAINATVTSGKTYALLTSVNNMHVNKYNPPIMDFYINGDSVGQLASTVVTPAATSGSGFDEGQAGWERFYGFWTADVTGTVRVAWMNQRTGGNGNDFAMDDLQLYEMNNDYTVTIQPNLPGDAPVVVTKDTTVVPAGGTVTITAETIDNGSSIGGSGCGEIDTMYLDKYDFTESDGASVTVTLTVVNIYGATSTGTATVTITGGAETRGPLEYDAGNDVYFVRNASELVYLSITDSLWDKDIVQIADIDFDTDDDGDYDAVDDWDTLYNSVTIDGGDWDSTGTAGDGTDAAGFQIIGNSGTKFTGSYRGGTWDGTTLTLNVNREIEDLFIDASVEAGLFGYVSGATVRDITLTDVDITSSSRSVGALIGSDDTGTNTAGTVTVANCFSFGEVVSTEAASNAWPLGVGGLIGVLEQADIDNCGSSANVSGYACVGGFIGSTDNGTTVDDCYATGFVKSSNLQSGGFIGGTFSNSVITGCYSTGFVKGTEDAGGFVGHTWSTSTVSNCYSTGAVNASTNIGGFVGQTDGSTIVNYCYATGDVSASSGGTNVGGFTGLDNGATYTSCHYDTGTTGSTRDVGDDGAHGNITGMATTGFKTQVTFTGAGYNTSIWDFDSNDDGRPYFDWQDDGADYNVSNDTADQVATGFSQVATYLGTLGTRGVRYASTSATQASDFTDASAVASNATTFTTQVTGLADGTYYVQPYYTRADGVREYGDMAITTVAAEEGGVTVCDTVFDYIFHGGTSALASGFINSTPAGHGFIGTASLGQYGGGTNYSVKLTNQPAGIYYDATGLTIGDTYYVEASVLSIDDHHFWDFQSWETGVGTYSNPTTTPGPATDNPPTVTYADTFTVATANTTFAIMKYLAANNRDFFVYSWRLIHCTTAGPDTVPPVANCQDATVYLDASGNGTLAASSVDNSSTDNVGIDTMYMTTSAFDCDDIGTVTDTLVVKDAAGNADSCTATITIADTIPPVFSNVPTDITDPVLPYDPDEPTITENCSGVTYTWTMTGATSATGTDTGTLGTNFNDGTTTVTYVATDASGNKDSCSFNVNVPLEVDDHCGDYDLSPPGGNIDTLEWVDECTGDTINEKTPNVYPTDTCLYRLSYVDFNGTNFITNGDFEDAPATGDWEDYTTYTQLETCFGNADVTTNKRFNVSTSPANMDPCDDHSSFGGQDWYGDFGDHTSGSGNMFYADGSTAADTVFATNTGVAVTSGNVYALVVWIANSHGNLYNPAEMDFYINGQFVGDLKGTIDTLAAETTHGNDVGIEGWERFYGFWTANTTGVVRVAFVNRNTVGTGNDFAMDDLALYEVQNDYTIQINPDVAGSAPTVITKDTTLLTYGGTVTITAETVDDGSFTTCGDIDTMYLDKYDFTDADQGTVTVTLTVVSVYGEVSIGTATITVDVNGFDTDSVTKLTETTATLYGNIIIAPDIKEFGFYYSTDNTVGNLANGTATEVKCYNGAATTFTDTVMSYDITGLTNRSAYYFRAYKKDNTDTYYYDRVVRFLTEKRDFSLYLDGINDAVIVDEASTAAYINDWGASNTTFSVDFWMKPSTVNSDREMFIADTMGAGGYLLYKHSKRLHIENISGSKLSTAVILNDDEWHHVAATFNSGTAKLYLDAEEVQSGALAISLPAADANCIIGCAYLESSTSLLNDFEGYLDALRFWNTELTLAQIGELAYDNISSNTGANTITSIGSGDAIAGLTASNLTASLGFNVKSTAEADADLTTLDYPTQDSMHTYPFFHADTRLSADSTTFNIVAINGANPSHYLPRVYWRNDAADTEWHDSLNWSGNAYPGQGVNSTLYPDVSSSDVADDSTFCKYTIVDESTNNAIVSTAPPEVQVLVDREDDTGTYRVDDAGGSLLKVMQSIVPGIFSGKGINAVDSEIQISEGAWEVFQ